MGSLESGLSWLALTSGGTVVSLGLLAWSCAGKEAHRQGPGGCRGCKITLPKPMSTIHKCESFFGHLQICIRENKLQFCIWCYLAKSPSIFI
jgi:hypothetical protein